MGIKIAYSTVNSAEDAAADIIGQLSHTEPKMVVFFASSAFDQELLSKKMQEGFSNAATFGCSTAGEIISGKMLKNSIVAMALDGDIISDVKVSVVQNIRDNGDIKKAFAEFEGYYGLPTRDMDYKKYVGIVLNDGLSMSEEKVMEKIGDLTNVVFIGGSAGDDLKFKRTCVYANGHVYSNASVLALMVPKNGFDYVKTQSFEVAGVNLTATRVNEQSREVMEFNGKPAALAYTEALNIPLEEASKSFMTNPVGLVAEDEIFVRSPQQIKDNSMIFYCNILDGMEVSLLNATDIVKDTKEALAKKKDIAGVINFNCILRTLELEQKGQQDAYAGIFKDIPTIGFSTYGEACFGHINQTSTMLIFK